MEISRGRKWWSDHYVSRLNIMQGGGGRDPCGGRGGLGEGTLQELPNPPLSRASWKGLDINLREVNREQRFERSRV